MAITYHVSIDILGALRKSDRWLDGMLAQDGRSMTGPEVRAFLRQQKEAGYVHFCGCDNREPNGQCAGHPTDKEA